LAVALLIQVGTNFANDVFDFEKGADTGERLGPTRAVQAGLLTAAQMRKGMILAFALAFLTGLYLSWIAGPILLALGIVSILAGVGYTGGPFPLAYNGLGDVFVLTFFGFVAVCGTAFVQVGAVPPPAWWAAVPVGCLATAILVVNNLRDKWTDEAAAKRTLAVRFGLTFTRSEYTALVFASYAVLPFLSTRLDSFWIFLPAVTLPLAVLLVGRIYRLGGAALNPTLASTARLLLLFSLLLAVGLVLSG